MHLIDTNVILRYTLNDNPEMARQAAEIIIAGAYTKPEVIAEVVYVLKSVYSIQKEEIKAIIQNISAIIYIENARCVLYALDLYASVSLDFVDCLLIAYHKINNENIFSFDKKLNKYLN
ncbi:MAG: PIN domain-containing protein [Lachnospiraceae bacterium]